MLRAAKVARIVANPTSICGIRFVSVQVVRKARPTDPESSAKSKPKWKGRGGVQTPPVKSKQARNKEKYHKLAARLAEIRGSSNSSNTTEPLTDEQKKLLELIQGPLLNSQDYSSVHKTFLRSNSVPVKQSHDIPSHIEKTHFDAILGRYVARSRLQSINSLEDSQKMTTFTPEGDKLRKKVTNFFKTRASIQHKRTRLPHLQQVDIAARMQLYREKLENVIRAELEFQIEQEKVYQVRLEGLTDQTRLEDQGRYKELKQIHMAEQSELLHALEGLGFGLVNNETLFSKVLLPSLLEYELTDGSCEYVHLVDLVNVAPKARPNQMKVDKFMNKFEGVPAAAVTDGRRIFAQFDKNNVVVFPSYSLTAAQLAECLKDTVISELERVKLQYNEADLEAVRTSMDGQYLDQYPAIKTTPGKDELEFSYFKIDESEKERYFKPRPVVEGVSDDPTIDVVLTPPSSTGYEEVAIELDRLRPESLVLPQKSWDSLSRKIYDNFLKSDLVRYIRERNKIESAKLSSMGKDQVIETLRDTVWGVKLTETIGTNVISKTFPLTEIEKLFLFKFHYQLVQLWVTRGAEVTFNNGDMVVSAPEHLINMVSVTLTQFGDRINSVEFELSPEEVECMTPQLWKVLEETHSCHFVFDGLHSVTMYHLGNASRKAKLIKRYIHMIGQKKPHLSQAIIYQTNNESVSKSAFFPRVVSHEQPWFQRVIPEWSRWREIHGSDYLVNVEQPQLSLVTENGTVKTLPSDKSLQQLIVSTLKSQLATLPSSVITQDENYTVQQQSHLEPELLKKAVEAGVVEPFDPSANNAAPVVYEKFSVTATIGHIVHANKPTHNSKGSLDVTKIDPIRDIHFSGSVPFLNEKLRSMFPKARPLSQERFKIVMYCEPVDSDAPHVEIESVSMNRSESIFKYPPPSVYAVTRQANLLVSLPAVNADMKYTAKSRQKLLPSQNLIGAWEKYVRGINRSENVDNPPDSFELNINGENITYKCINVVYTRHDEYPVASFDKSDAESTGGVVMHRNTTGGDLCGVRNEVSVEAIWRDYVSENDSESQQVSDALLDDFVGNSLKFMDSLDAESVPL